MAETKKVYNDVKTSAYHKMLNEKLDKEMDASFVKAGLDSRKRHADLAKSGELLDKHEGIVYPDGDDCLHNGPPEDKEA